MTTLLVWLGVATLGGLGAILRFELDGFVQRRLDSEFPFGTLAVNGLGSLLLGTLVGLDVAGNDLLIAGTATLGSFTTFSTWMLEAERLAEDGEGGLALADIVGSIAVGIAAAALGWALGAAL
ncbi:CrcB-like protein [Gaiella occulta]|uniref:Fluoride-specific ion channel FluC n=1 Tax=Gaiella occulta TaxID=1002870 RepID=A0A7M2YY90_9ACTN|nr:fluoride efflux transporter CrcB [Gaiella occulta]RDI75117.1 CrcB-like protein [Gaiella occulta]